MESHLHCTIQHEEISKIVKNFKSYTAKMIINSLEKRGRSLILDKLIFAKKIQKKQSQYQVWQEGVHPTQIDSDEKMEKVLDYIHFNPVKAGFVSNPEHWRYSSAIDYTGKGGLVPVTLFGENRSLSLPVGRQASGLHCQAGAWERRKISNSEYWFRVSIEEY